MHALKRTPQGLMSIRPRTSAPAKAATARTFEISPNTLREGIARSLAPRATLECRADPAVERLSRTDATLIHKLNEPYKQSLQGDYQPPTVITHPNSIEYRSNAYMEHHLDMKLETQGHGDDTIMTFTMSSNANPIQDVETGQTKLPPNLDVVHLTYRPTDAGCYKKLYARAFEIEDQWKYHPQNKKEAGLSFVSGAPYFSAIGLGLEAMLNAASGSDQVLGLGSQNSMQFTNNQAMLRGGAIPIYNQIRFLINHYATAATAFRSTDHLNVLQNETRYYQMMRQ